MCQGGFPGLPHVAPYTQWTKSMEDKTKPEKGVLAGAQPLWARSFRTTS